MRVSAKADYALRACIQLAAAEGEGHVKGERIAQAQEVPLKFLENILGDLRHAALVRSQRGAEGGYWLARPAAEITLAEVIRAVEGPLANVRGVRPDSISYQGTAEPLKDVWIAVARPALVLEALTLADVASGSAAVVRDRLGRKPGRRHRSRRPLGQDAKVVYRRPDGRSAGRQLHRLPPGRG